MLTKIRMFLDTSALFAAIWSATGGGREILRLGEAGLLQLLVSAQVLKELEDALRRKAPAALGALTLLLDRAGVEVVDEPSAVVVARSQELITHPGDALVLAAAWEADVDYFVTLDGKHFLENAALRDVLTFPIGTSGDFLKWYRRQVGNVSSA